MLGSLLLSTMLSLSVGVAPGASAPSWHLQGNALSPAPIPAAIIGPTEDWKPLFAGAEEFHINRSTIDRLLAAGGELVCKQPFVDPSGKEKILVFALNGWFLEDTTSSVNTNAHAIIDDDGKLWPFLSTCNFTLFKDEIADAKPATYPIDPDPSTLALGTYNPNHEFAPKDRAVIQLQQPVPDALPLRVGSTRIDVHEGDQVFIITSGRWFNNQQLATQVEPLIQECTIRRAVEAWKDLPGGILTDCDNHKGTSGGLYFARDPLHVGDLAGC